MQEKKNGYQVIQGSLNENGKYEWLSQFQPEIFCSDSYFQYFI